jgi:hypothetical protein
MACSWRPHHAREYHAPSSAGLRGSTANWTNQNEAVADGALVSGELHRAHCRQHTPLASSHCIAIQSRNSVKSSCHTRAMPPPTQRSAAWLCSQPAHRRADLCRVYASDGDDWAHYDLRAAHPHPVVHQQTPRGVVRGVSAHSTLDSTSSTSSAWNLDVYSSSAETLCVYVCTSPPCCSVCTLVCLSSRAASVIITITKHHHTHVVCARLNS